MRFAPAAEIESRPRDLPAHPLSGRKRAALWTGFILSGAAAAFLMYAGCIYLTVILKGPFAASDGLLWSTAMCLGGGLITSVIACWAAWGRIRTAREHRAALAAAEPVAVDHRGDVEALNAERRP